MPSYINKTVNYLRRNGVKNTYYAVMERLTPGGMADYKKYTYVPPTEEELEKQRQWSADYTQTPPLFSILVPAYETKEEYLKELLDSVLNQTCKSFELILADASKSNAVKDVVEKYEDKRIRYYRLEENKGISGNTLAAAEYATGAYVGLLDHDDLLTPNALYEMAKVIEGEEPWMVYSDEDKCDGTSHYFYEPHIKTKFNLDLILTNNYICHFMIVKRELFTELGLREAYDGAQDYDFVLRVVGKLLQKGLVPEEKILHVAKVLYHWRCHTGSTAQNPQSKLYAYDAGKRAVENFLEENGMDARVEHTTHLGFYKPIYTGDILSQRQDIAVIGGKLLNEKNKISGGIYTEEGEILYEGLDAHFSGYLHRASLIQNTDAVDIRCMRLQPEWKDFFAEYFGVQDAWVKKWENQNFSTEHIWKEIPALAGMESEEAYRKVSIDFCKEVREKGYRILWNPEWCCRI